MAVTTSDWPTRASPQANTPSTEVREDRRLDVAARVEVEAQLARSAPSCSGWVKPMATRHEVGLLHELAAWTAAGRARGALHPAPVHARHVAVLALDAR